MERRFLLKETILSSDLSTKNNKNKIEMKNVIIKPLPSFNKQEK